jgi:hypothetical protein
MVPFVPTGMYTGVRTSPCGSVMVSALAYCEIACVLQVSGLFSSLTCFRGWPNCYS